MGCEREGYNDARHKFFHLLNALFDNRFFCDKVGLERRVYIHTIQYIRLVHKQWNMHYYHSKQKNDHKRIIVVGNGESQPAILIFQWMRLFMEMSRNKFENFVTIYSVKS